MDNKSGITFKPAKTQRASDVIYQQIYQKIMSGELKAGERLPAERELCEQFGRSRPSVREALRMLQQGGLVNITVGTNGGAVVQGISLDSAEQPLRKLIDFGAITLQELVDYRSFNDQCCAHLAALYRTEEDTQKLQDISDQYGKAVYDSPRLREIDIQFHKILAQSSHNKLCILITDVVTALCTDLFWNVATKDMPENEVYRINKKAYENHRDIAEAVINKDMERLVVLMDAATNLFSDSVHLAL